MIPTMDAPLSAPYRAMHGTAISLPMPPADWDDAAGPTSAPTSRIATAALPVVSEGWLNDPTRHWPQSGAAPYRQGNGRVVFRALLMLPRYIAAAAALRRASAVVFACALGHAISTLPC
jgi:hypothetical protein